MGKYSGKLPFDSKFIGKTCIACELPFKYGNNVVLCPECKTLYHKNCWMKNNGCIVKNCNYYKKYPSEKNKKQSKSIDINNDKIKCPYCAEYIQLTPSNRCPECDSYLGKTDNIVIKPEPKINVRLKDKKSVTHTEQTQKKSFHILFFIVLTSIIASTFLLELNYHFIGTLLNNDIQPFHKTSKYIKSAKGGTIRLQKVALEIPSNALYNDTKISINVPDQRHPISPRNNADFISTPFEILPSMSFRRPVTLTLPYPQINGLDEIVESRYYIAVWNGSYWKRLSSTVNTRNNTISAEINHFSVFAVFYEKVEQLAKLLHGEYKHQNIHPSQLNVSIQKNVNSLRQYDTVEIQEASQFSIPYAIKVATRDVSLLKKMDESFVSEILIQPFTVQHLNELIFTCKSSLVEEYENIAFKLYSGEVPKTEDLLGDILFNVTTELTSIFSSVLTSIGTKILTKSANILERQIPKPLKNIWKLNPQDAYGAREPLDIIMVYYHGKKRTDKNRYLTCGFRYYYWDTSQNEWLLFNDDVAVTVVSEIDQPTPKMAETKYWFSFDGMVCTDYFILPDHIKKKASAFWPCMKEWETAYYNQLNKTQYKPNNIQIPISETESKRLLEIKKGYYALKIKDSEKVYIDQINSFYAKTDELSGTAAFFKLRKHTNTEGFYLVTNLIENFKYIPDKIIIEKVIRDDHKYYDNLVIRHLQHNEQFISECKSYFKSYRGYDLTKQSISNQIDNLFSFEYLIVNSGKGRLNDIIFIGKSNYDHNFTFLGVVLGDSNRVIKVGYPGFVQTFKQVIILGDHLYLLIFEGKPESDYSGYFLYKIMANEAIALWGG